MKKKSYVKIIVMYDMIDVHIVRVAFKHHVG